MSIILDNQNVIAGRAGGRCWQATRHWLEHGTHDSHALTLILNLTLTQQSATKISIRWSTPFPFPLIYNFRNGHSKSQTVHVSLLRYAMLLVHFVILITLPTVCCWNFLFFFFFQCTMQHYLVCRVCIVSHSHLAFSHVYYGTTIVRVVNIQRATKPPALSPLFILFGFAWKTVRIERKNAPTVKWQVPLWCLFKKKKKKTNENLFGCRLQVPNTECWTFTEDSFI